MIKNNVKYYYRLNYLTFDLYTNLSKYNFNTEYLNLRLEG